MEDQSFSPQLVTGLEFWLGRAVSRRILVAPPLASGLQPFSLALWRYVIMDTPNCPTSQKSGNEEISLPSILTFRRAGSTPVVYRSVLRSTIIVTLPLTSNRFMRLVLRPSKLGVIGYPRYTSRTEKVQLPGASDKPTPHFYTLSRISSRA